MFNKNLEAENPCPMDLLSRGGGQHAVCRKSLVSSRKFNKLASLGNILHPFGHNELTSNYSRLTTKTAFTMAEILLSLTIIGVVAAITLPSLTGNINERTWNTQRKALYSRISQAISLMPALNNYGTTGDNATETFITAGLSKVLKINNICSENIADCGIVSKFTTFDNRKIDMPTTLHGFNGTFSQVDAYGSASYSTKNTNATAFETQNGESVVAFYNQTCKSDYLSHATLSFNNNTFGFPQATMCVNFIFDLNGKKGPNTVGKDIGYITVFNATDSVVVMPVLSSLANATYEGSDTMAWENASKACTQQDPESRLPNIDEASAILLNKELTGLSGVLWTSTILASNPKQVWEVHATSSIRFTEAKDQTRRVRCIKR